MARRRGALAAVVALLAVAVPLAAVGDPGGAGEARLDQAGAGPTETIQLAPGQKVTTTTVFKPPPAQYTVTVTGTIVETNPPFGPTVPAVVCSYDAFYEQCTGGPNPPGAPSGINPGLTARSATLNSSLDIFTRARTRPEFRSDHSYTITLDAVDAGTLLLEAWPRGSRGPGVTHTGGLTVQIAVPSGAPSSPTTCAGSAATIAPDSADPVGTPIFGTPGDDVIVGTDADDQIFGRGGEDRICALAGNDLVLGNAGRDQLFGDDGDDQLRGGDDAARDLLIGDAGEDRLLAGPGDDLLDGGPGKDVVSGGPGDDELTASTGVEATTGGDRLLGGPGEDLVSYSSLGAALRRDVIVDLEEGEGRIGRIPSSDDLRDVENVRGTRYNDFIVGDDGPNVLYGGRGTDRLRGRGDRDHLLGERDGDVLFGDAGRDDLRGGPGDDICGLDARDDPPGSGDCERRLGITR